MAKPIEHKRLTGGNMRRAAREAYEQWMETIEEAKRAKELEATVNGADRHRELARRFPAAFSNPGSPQ